MKNKKLHFFNTKYRKNPSWSNILISVLIGIGSHFMMDLLERSLISRIAVVAFMLIGIGGIIWSQTRENAIFFQREKDFKLKLAGKKLEMNLNFLSEVWIENEELNIRRINRVDTFDIAHLRTEDVDKLVRLLEEYEPQLA